MALVSLLPPPDARVWLSVFSTFVLSETSASFTILEHVFSRHGLSSLAADRSIVRKAAADLAAGTPGSGVASVHTAP